MENAAGTGQTELTIDPSMDHSPSWSPDGAMIAFFSDRDDDWEIYMMNADGSGQVNITNSPGEDRFPSWGP